VAEGALTDELTEIIWCCFGNPTRSTGRFRDCFGRFKQRWHTQQIDSREVKITNKKQIQEWLEDYGEDSDFFKVRVRGVFPSADFNALLTFEQVEAAMNRQYREDEISHGARIIGVDVARQGGDSTVIAKRRAMVIYPLVAMQVPDNMLVASRIATTIDEWTGCDAVHIDASGGYGVGVVDALRSVNRKCTEVYFGGKATDPRFFDKRSEMAWELAAWIKDKGWLPRDNNLREELLALTVTFERDRFRLCSKDDIKDEIGRSPDRADACMLTFAYPVVPSTNPLRNLDRSRRGKSLDYDPLTV
jgi:hypothetical protein